MENPEKQGYEQKDSQKPNPELEERKRTPEETAGDFLDEDTAREGADLERKGLFFQDVQKWQKALSLKAVRLAQAGIAIYGGVLIFSPTSSDTGAEISKIILLAAVATASHFLERSLSRSIKKDNEKGNNNQELEVVEEEKEEEDERIS